MKTVERVEKPTAAWLMNVDFLKLKMREKNKNTLDDGTVAQNRSTETNFQDTVKAFPGSLKGILARFSTYSLP